MVMVLELLVMSHTIHIDRAKEKTYRNSKGGFFIKASSPDKLHIAHIGKFAVTCQEGYLQPVSDRIPNTIDC